MKFGSHISNPMLAQTAFTILIIVIVVSYFCYRMAWPLMVVWIFAAEIVNF